MRKPLGLMRPFGSKCFGDRGFLFIMASAGSSVPAPDAPPMDECPIMGAWKGLDGIVERAGREGRICFVGAAGISRQCVIDNVDILQPIINTLGAQASNFTSAYRLMCVRVCVFGESRFEHAFKDFGQVFLQWKI